MTRIRVKMQQNRHLYVLNIFEPGSRKSLARQRRSRKPFASIEAGDTIRAAKRRLLVTAVAHRIEQHENRVEHIVDVFTRLPSPKRVNRRRLAGNVVPMPTGDASMVAQFFRYHVLVRVFGGDPDAWLARLEQEGGDEGGDGGDLRFVRWIRSRLRQDPALLGAIRAMVDSTPFWRAAEA